ncbi:DMT family transporter [Sporolactobacillus shoreicorticis]|uniref:DMT family transporter n=1 Tax=Sporolactobacillus shoreicorticis TaxID=1923877 RepID=A0ABW5S1K4_9BACL|nr:DMT family transporter [Sporolactobacillus shoreicorticis]MCO7126460.1 DMT family transporter [Sporolactobacillus shoreicorticis]
MTNKNTFLGLMYGIIAGASWGLAYLVPNMLSAFSSLEISLGRYLMYGLYSLFLFFFYKKNPLKISLKIWLRALQYALIGNLGYFFFLVLGIKLVGASVATLIIGILPITISFFGNLRNREFPFKILFFPSAFVLVGMIILCLNGGQNGPSIDPSEKAQLLGIFFCLTALALWTWYGVSNAHLLKDDCQISSDFFSTIIGIQTLVLVLVVSLVSILLKQPILHRILIHRDLSKYVVGIIVLGIFTSWIATWAWNNASIKLPVSIAGMMIVFETVFGLLYSYLYNKELPSLSEFFCIALVLFGVALAIWKTNKYKRSSKKHHQAVI